MAMVGGFGRRFITADPGVGQIAGVVLSAIIIFLVYTLPAQRRAMQKDNDEKTQSLFNEEDT